MPPGQRKDQSPGTRMAVPVVEVDPVFEGVEGGPGSLIKYNPLSNMSSAETWNFLRVMGVPTNKLHACGYISIGCEPCTRPVLPNQVGAAAAGERGWGSGRRRGSSGGSGSGVLSWAWAWAWPGRGGGRLFGVLRLLVASRPQQLPACITSHPAPPFHCALARARPAARARGPLVVGGRDRQGVRPAQRQREEERGRLGRHAAGVARPLGGGLCGRGAGQGGR